MRTFKCSWLGGVALAIATLAVPGRPLVAQVMDRHVHTFFLFDQLEQRRVQGSHPVAWDALGWTGGDVNRFWFRSTGAHSTRGAGQESEIEALYGRLIAPFWDFLIGAQLDTRVVSGTRRARGSFVVGLEGLAPYWFEVEPSIFISDRGDVSAELNATYELFVTQRLVAQPRIDVRAAVQEVAAFGVGSGLNDTGLGLRLRYEFSRKFAPYAGVRWTRTFAGTAVLARAAGEPEGGTVFVTGLRTWF